MCNRIFLARVLPSLVFICLFAPDRASAQLLRTPPGYTRPGPYGYGYHGSYPTPPSYWSYPGLNGGPYITTGYQFAGWPGFRNTGTGLFHRPQVPVYAPLPYADPNYPWSNLQSYGGWGYFGGLGYFGWLGPFRASPRPTPTGIHTWPVIEPIGSSAARNVAPYEPSAECLHISLKLPQPASEVFVDGVKTLQFGTDRLYESPPLEAGKEYAYDILVRWVEGGTTFERKKTVIGKPGNVERVDFTAP